ncbi:MAG: endonuclease domain-containing protein [Geobacteraceae bacterium]|nr:endonuclease domain-containing protein [Geobacteraceae bacterium]
MKPRNFLASNARYLRNNSTDAERLLWRHLRHSQLEGVKFRRQQAVESYIVDFVSYTPKLAIELDGSQHMNNGLPDEKRNICLQNNGFTVLRFWNNEVFENLQGVLEVIRKHCLESASPTPQPPPASGGGV